MISNLRLSIISALIAGGVGFSISACAPIGNPAIERIQGIDPTFNHYYDLFAATYGFRPTTPIGFNILQLPTVGLCQSWSDGYRDIAIDPVYWMTLPEDKCIVLIYHELGHCVFNRLHNWDTFPGDPTCPLSIMQFDNFGDPCYAAHQKEYDAELPKQEPGDHL